MKLSKILKKHTKYYRYKFRTWLIAKKTEEITNELKIILQNSSNKIPVIIVSYNNGVYVDNTVKQLNTFNIEPIIIDNNSSCENTLKVLNELKTKSLASVIKSKHNHGHMVGFLKPIYDLLPDVFAYTDPDLQFNENLPENFLDVLAELTNEFPVFKAGFALSLENNGPIKDTRYPKYHYKPIHFERNFTIKEFESMFWTYRLMHKHLELYGADIDTTFAVYRKSNFFGNFYSAVRVAGDYSAIHLPWFEDLELFSEEDKKNYNKKNISSNW